MSSDWLDNKYDFGLVTGLGRQVDLNKSLILSLEFRNSFGLTPITANDCELTT